MKLEIEVHMGSFAQFYQQGGIFMHLVTLSAVGACICVGAHMLGHSANRGRSRYLDLGRSLLWIGALLGLMGTAFGFMETGMALASIDDLAKWPAGAARGMSISMHTLAWSMMTAVPLAGAMATLRFRAAASGDSNVGPDALVTGSGPGTAAF